MWLLYVSTARTGIASVNDVPKALIARGPWSHSKQYIWRTTIWCATSISFRHLGLVAHLAAVCRQADILVAALGRPAALTADFIQPGAVVVDVGINRIADRKEARLFRDSKEKLDAFDRKGSVLVGDVHPLDAAAKASAYTPVPGGVGPLTVAMLMLNTVESAGRRLA